MKARDYCIEAHAGQIRHTPRGDEPYHNHPIRVSEMVTKWGGTTEEVEAALLHDVLEDTKVTYTELHATFGETVAHMVDDLSDKFTKDAYPMMNRAKRKDAEASRIAIRGDVHLVKLCDLYDNLVDTDVSKGFGRVFASEVSDLLLVLKGPKELLALVTRACDDLAMRDAVHRAKEIA